MTYSLLWLILIKCSCSVNCGWISNSQSWNNQLTVLIIDVIYWTKIAKHWLILASQILRDFSFWCVLYLCYLNIFDFWTFGLEKQASWIHQLGLWEIVNFFFTNFGHFMIKQQKNNWLLTVSCNHSQCKNVHCHAKKVSKIIWPIGKEHPDRLSWQTIKWCASHKWHSLKRYYCALCQVV